jgi:hypothetical protein
MESKRSTVYLDAELHQAFKLRSVETECSISHLINEALRAQLSIDADDLSEFQIRSNEKILDFEKFVQKLKTDGKISHTARKLTYPLSNN